jgi:hypothetical protein
MATLRSTFIVPDDIGGNTNLTMISDGDKLLLTLYVIHCMARGQWSMYRNEVKTLFGTRYNRLVSLLSNLKLINARPASIDATLQLRKLVHTKLVYALSKEEVKFHTICNDPNTANRTSTKFHVYENVFILPEEAEIACIHIYSQYNLKHKTSSAQKKFIKQVTGLIAA